MPVVIEASYFHHDSVQQDGNPAGVMIARNGGVVPKHKVPHGTCSETCFVGSLANVSRMAQKSRPVA